MQGKDDHILKLPVTLMRGGTSKGVYLLEEDLPEDHNEWDKILLRLMGSPDQKQIDGLGGSQSVTSKVAIIKKSDRSDADVDYTFAQVSVDKPVVSYKGREFDTSKLKRILQSLETGLFFCQIFVFII